MLTELYRYALDHGLAAQPGFKPKRVKAYVLLSADGKFLGVHVREKMPPPSMHRILAQLPMGPVTVIR